MIEISPIEFTASIKHIEILGLAYPEHDNYYYRVQLYDENKKIIRNVDVGIEKDKINNLIIDLPCVCAVLINYILNN